MEKFTLSKPKDLFADYSYYPVSESIGYYRLIAATYKNIKFEENSILISGIEKVLHNLTPLYIQVVRLRFWKNYNQCETAKALNLSNESIRIIEQKVYSIIQTNHKFFLLDNIIKKHEMILLFLNNLKNNNLNNNTFLIEDLELSNNVISYLAAHNIITLDQLIHCTQSDFNKIFGHKTKLIDEVISVVQDFLPGWIPNKLKTFNTDSSDELYTIEDVDSSLLSAPIISLQLSTRAINCLKRTGVNTVEELFALSNAELIKLKNLGTKTFDEINNMKKQLTRKLPL